MNKEDNFNNPLRTGAPVCHNYRIVSPISLMTGIVLLNYATLIVFLNVKCGQWTVIIIFCLQTKIIGWRRIRNLIYYCDK